ncbi:MAG: hypothetical protein V4549_18125 [Bacteroidota bacterium]
MIAINPESSFNTVVSSLTGLPKSAIEELGKAFIDGLIVFLKWMEDPINIGDWKGEDVVNINEESFGKLLQLELAQQEKNIVEIIKIYYPDRNVLQMNLYDAIYLTNNLNDQLSVYLKKESEQLHFKATPEQKRAGIDKFNKFGRGNTLDSLSNGDLLKQKDICDLEVNVIFAKLLRMKTESDYQRNYTLIMSEKK